MKLFKHWRIEPSLARVLLWLGLMLVFVGTAVRFLSHCAL